MGWEPCYSSPVEAHAYLVKEYLEQYGVPCIIENLRFGMEPTTIGVLGEIRILVREEWVAVARGLIRGRESAGGVGGRRRGERGTA